MLMQIKLGGRPRSFTDPQELLDKINCYFADCHEDDEPPFMLEMAHYLGICRDTMAKYARGEYDDPDDAAGEKLKYSDAIKKAKQLIEITKAKRLVKGRWNTVGLIFDLKNNHGWADKTESIVETTLTTVVSKDMSADEAQDAYSKQMG